MQSFETLFQRAWERSRERKLGIYIVLVWVLLLILAGALSAATVGTYYVLVEKRQAKQSVVESNPELARIFSPERELRFNDVRLTFASRRGDKLRQVVLRTPNEEIRAKSAELQLDAEKSTVSLTLRGYRIHKVVGGVPSPQPTRVEDWGTWVLSYRFELPPGVRTPEKPEPGNLAHGVAASAVAALAGIVLWCWIWQMLTTGLVREAADERPTRILRGLRSGFSRWWTVMYPATLVSVAGVVGFIGSLPNILQLPIPLYLVIYPATCVLEITLLVLSGIMMTGVAVNPPDVNFGELMAETVRVFLNAWGRYLVGMFWLYAFLALSVVLLAPGAVLLMHAAVFANRLLLWLAIAWIALWLAAFILTGIRVRGCIAAYFMYLYRDAAENAKTPNEKAAAARKNDDPPPEDGK